MTIEIQLNNEKIVLGNVYRSPNPPAGVTNTTALENFTTELENYFNSLTNTRKHSLVFLDANINLLKQNNITYDYLSSALTSGFVQIISKATRIQGKNFSLIDHIFSNDKGIPPTTTGVITTDISDHFTTFAQLPNKTANHHKTPSISKRNITPDSLNNFKTSLRALSWNNVLALDNVDDSFNTFGTYLKNYMTYTSL
jgi:hypothetical protein